MQRVAALRSLLGLQRQGWAPGSSRVVRCLPGWAEDGRGLHWHVSCLPAQLPGPMEGLSSQLDQSVFILGTRWSSWMLSPSLGTNPASRLGQPAALPTTPRRAQPHFAPLSFLLGRQELLSSVPISLHTSQVLLCQRQVQGVDPRCCTTATTFVAWRDPPPYQVTAGILSPSWEDAGLHLPSHQTPLSSSRSSTHLPILKLLRAVDTLKGPRLDSLRLLDQLRAQDWGGEVGKGSLTFNHLKVGWFCWLGPWLSGQAEPRLLPCRRTPTTRAGACSALGCTSPWLCLEGMRAAAGRG